MTAGLYPFSVDGGPANRYAAGTFIFAVVPEPGTAALVMLGGVLVGSFRRRRRC